MTEEMQFATAKQCREINDTQDLKRAEALSLQCMKAALAGARNLKTSEFLTPVMCAHLNHLGYVVERYENEDGDACFTGCITWPSGQ